MITKDASLTGMSSRDFLFIGVLTCVAVGFSFLIIKSAETSEAEISNNILQRSELLSGSVGSGVITADTSMMNTESDVQEHVATVVTSKGVIEIELFTDKAAKTVANFEKLAQEGFYNGTRFHRVISGFMIQGGDPLSKDVAQKNMWGTGGPGYTFDDEINDEQLVQGVLAMANAGPGTNGSQFFIVTAEATPWLDGHHTAFGRVVSGMEIVLDIENTPTDERDRPLEDVVVESIALR
jgi:cyclophilin family peptidyl-prolyl cis-trans isomerase